MKIAIAVQHDLTKPNTSSDDWLIKPELEKQGIEVDIIDWRNKQVDLNKYDSIYVSSTWNASLDCDEFIDWIKACEKQGKKLINDSELLLLGLHKDEYLNLLKKEFGEQDSLMGSITPSAFIKTEDEVQSFADVRQELVKDVIWQGDLVIKPIVSAVGRDTYLITNNPHLLKRSGDKYRPFKDAEAIVQSLLDKKGSKGIIIQPFMKGVESSGEYQLVFIDAQFSHAIVKAKGFGNRIGADKKTVAAKDLPPGMLNFAQNIIQFYATTFPHGVTRARLDFFVGEKGPVLCEAEVVEPHTNIRRFPVEQQRAIVSRYAQALIKRMVGLKLQAILGEEAQAYFPMLENPSLLKAVRKIHESNEEILHVLASSGSGKKHHLAMTYSSTYIKQCLNAFNDFSERNHQNKELLLTALAQAKDDYTKSVLGKDRSPVSMTVRYLLAALVNFVAGLTFGFAHYTHYKNTGSLGFFTETNSASQLRKSHHELNQELDQSFSL